jgi:hypothetical protein
MTTRWTPQEARKAGFEAAKTIIHELEKEN